MKSGRFFTFSIIILCICCLPAANALAFWGLGEEQGKSGLDFEKGYDLNTVTTVKGKVISIDSGEGSVPVTIIVQQRAGKIHAVAAPGWFWSDRGISIKPNEEIEVSGAKAQGKDGNMYIISREITNISTGKAVTLRTENGRAAWRGGGRAGRSGGGMQRRHGGGARGR
jgi:hypothetical protein